MKTLFSLWLFYDLHVPSLVMPVCSNKTLIYYITKAQLADNKYEI